MKNLIATFAAAILFVGIASLGFAYSYTPEGPEGPEKIEAVKTLGKVTLAESSSCASIEKHTPVGSASNFSLDVGKVWIYTKFTMDKEVSSKIKHRYIFNGKKISEVELNVKGPSFRTYSYKTITKEMAGDWKVEVVGEDGGIFETIEFTVEK